MMGRSRESLSDTLAAVEIMADSETVCSDHGAVRDSGCGECIGADAVDLFCSTLLEVIHSDDPLRTVWATP